MLYVVCSVNMPSWGTTADNTREPEVAMATVQWRLGREAEVGRPRYVWIRARAREVFLMSTGFLGGAVC